MVARAFAGEVSAIAFYMELTIAHIGYVRTLLSSSSSEVLGVSGSNPSGGVSPAIVSWSRTVPPVITATRKIHCPYTQGYRTIEMQTEGSKGNDPLRIYVPDSL